MADVTTVAISGLTPANASATDLIEVAQVNPSSSTGYGSMRTSLTSVANLIVNDIQYASDLETTDKTIIGAINEVAQSVGHNYSTTEQRIGTWIDGNTLYEKTYTGLNVSITNVNTWYDTDLSASGIDTFIDGKMIDVNNQAYPVNVAFLSNNTKIGISCGMANRTGVTLTIQYTKSS